VNNEVWHGASAADGSGGGGSSSGSSCDEDEGGENFAVGFVYKDCGREFAGITEPPLISP
jgi:hypothetical protein